MKQIIVDNISTTYYITEDGKCYNEKTNNWLKGQINSKNGYRTYHIALPSGKAKRIYAHRAVAEAYLPNPEKKEQVNHKDGDKLNNCATNLEWVSCAENLSHALENGLREVREVYCFSPDKCLVAIYKSCGEAGRAVGITQSQLYMELTKEEKTLTGGFYWSYSLFLGKTKSYPNTGRAKKVNQYTLEGKYIMTYQSCGQAARATHSNNSHIAECCRGKLKSHNGFVWRYLDDIVSPLDESLSASQEQQDKCYPSGREQIMNPGLILTNSKNIAKLKIRNGTQKM